jgi:hypothetical protein
MDNKLRSLDLELSLVLARIYKYLKIRSGISIDILHSKFSKLDMTFFPLLSLIAGQGSKGITNKNRTLAVVSQIVFLSTEIHNQIPESTEKSQFAKQVQLPILVGDLLYSRFYEILCKNDCIEYLDYFLDYLSNLNLKWVDYLDQKIEIEELSTSCYGDLGSLVMELNLKTNNNNHYWIKIGKRYGYAIGSLYGASKFKLSEQEIIKYWEMVLETINLMPLGEIKDYYSQFAHELYNNLFPSIIQENNFQVSAVAEN